MRLVGWMKKLFGKPSRFGFEGKRGNPRDLIPHLRVMRLETRRVLNGDGAVTELFLDAGAAANDGQADTFHIQTVQNQVQVSVNGEVVSRTPLQQLNAITLLGSTDDDIVIADFSHGSLAGLKLAIEGGTGSDVLRLVSDNPAKAVNHALGKPGDGHVEITSGASTSTVSYNNIETLHQSLSTENLVIQFGHGRDSVTLATASHSGESQLSFSQPENSAANAEQKFALTFANPLQELRINTASDEAALADAADGDHVIVTGLDASFDANFVLLSDRNDSLLFVGHSNFGSGGLSISAGNIEIQGAISTKHAAIDITATDWLTITDSGSIHNPGGSVMLVASRLEHDGTLTAHGGLVDLDSGAAGVTIVRGIIDVSQRDEGQSGGEVHVLGMQVGLFDQARIDASGSSGGGIVLIGGDYQGKGAVRTANVTYVDRAAVVNADATVNGRGGKVIAWANHTARVHGTLTARGGSQLGDGGFIETSGKMHLDVNYSWTDASAVHGAAGTWLLDPISIQIIIGNLNTNGAFSGDVFTPSGAPSQIGVDNINARLNLGTSVTITTDDAGSGDESGNVTQLAGAIILLNNVASTVDLHIFAAGSITLNGGIVTTAGVLNVYLTANDNSGTQNDLDTASGDVIINSNVSTGGGTFESSGVNFDNSGGTISTGGGHVNLNHTGAATLGADIDAGSGNVGISAVSGNVEGGGVVTANVITAVAGGGIGIVTPLNSNANTLNLTSSGAAAAGNITVVEADGVSLSVTTAATAQTISVTTTTGNLTVGAAMGDANDSLTLNATAGNLVGGGVLTANALTLTAGGGIGVGTAVTVNATTYNLSTAGVGAAGNITLVDSGALNTSQISTLTTDVSAQTISLTASAGNLTIDGAIGNATDNLVLSATSGDVEGGATASANVLSVNAGGGIGIVMALNTNANTLNLTSSGAAAAGNITVVEADDMSLSVTTAATAQAISVTTTTGNLTVGAAMGDANDSLTLNATAGNLVGGGVLTANALTLTAGGGIGVGTAVTVNATTYNLSTAGVGAAGNITLVDSGALNTSQISTLTTDASAQTISLTASVGNLTTDGAIGNATDNLVLSATSGDVEGGATATANVLSVNAGGGIGIVTPLNTNANTLNLTSGGAAGAGNITVVEADGVSLSVTTAATAQTISVTATTGDLTVGAASGDANDSLTLNATAGNLVGGGMLTANALTLTAGGGIGVGTAVTVNATTYNLSTAGVGAAGNITLVDSGALNTSQISTLTTDVSAQTISLTASAGNLTIDGAIGDATDNLTLISTSGNVVGGGTVTANALTLTAGGGIGVGTAVTVNATTYNLSTAGIGAAGNITLVDSGALNTSQITALTTDASAQTISLTASAGNLMIDGAIGNATDNLILTAVTGNMVGGGLVTANMLSLIAGSGIGIGTAVTANATTYNLSTAGVGAAGNITLVDSGALNTSQVTVTTDTTAQTISLTASAGNLTIDGAIGNATDSLALSATSGNVEGGATATANGLSVNAGGGIGVGTAVTAHATTYNLSTAGVGAAGNITLVDSGALTTSQISTLTTDASTQTISLTASAGNLTIGGAIGNATDNLTLISTSGNVVGGGTVTANVLALTAGGGIGVGTVVTANATTYNLSTAGVGAAGNITLVDSGTLNTSQISTLTTDASTQTISLTASVGNLTMDGVIGNATDNLVLSATSGDVEGGATATANVLSVNAGGGIGIVTPLNTNANTLNLTSGGAAGAGNITVVEADGVSLSVTTAATAQTISVTATTGDLTVGAAMGDANDSLTLNATAGNLVGGGMLTANALTLTAGGGIGVGTAVTVNATTYNLSTAGVGAAGNITLVDSGALNTSQISTLTTDASTQTISLTASAGNLTIGGAIGNATDNLTLISTSGNVVGGGTVTANVLALTAGGGIGVGTAVTVNATTYNLSTAGVGAAGNITLVDLGALNTSQITTLTTDASAQTISLTASAGNLTMDGAIGNAIDNLILTAVTGNMLGGGLVTANMLTLTAGGGIGVGTVVTANATTYNLSTAGVGAAGNITLVDSGALNTSQVTLMTDTTAQTISLTALAGNLTIDGAIGNATDSLTLIAASGGIVNANATVTASLLTMEATAGVSLKTSVMAIDVVNGNSGNIEINEVDDVVVQRLFNNRVDDADKTTGTIKLTAGGEITVVGGGAGVIANDGDIRLIAERVTLQSDIRTTQLGTIVIDFVHGLSLTNTAVLSTASGQISGQILNDPNPLAGSQSVGPLLNGTERLAVIHVQIQDSQGLGYDIEIDWREGNPLGPVFVPPNDLRAQRVGSTIAFATVSEAFSHNYENAPDSANPAADIGAMLRISQFARGTIELNSGGESVLSQDRFMSILTIGVSAPVLAFFSPVPEPDRINLLPKATPILVNLPTQQRTFDSFATQQINNSVGTATQASDRFYVLRVVSFKVGGVQEGDDVPLMDLDEPDSQNGFELSQLPELFKRLPDDRYRIYLKDGPAEELVLDFIIRDGQPVEAQDEEPVHNQDNAPAVDPAAALTPPVDGAFVEEQLVPAKVQTKGKPVAGETDEVGSEDTSASSASSGNQPDPVQSAAVERLGSVPVVSSGGVLFGAGMLRSWAKKSGRASRDVAIERLGSRTRKTL